MVRVPPSSIDKSEITFGKSHRSMSPIIEASSFDEQSQNAITKRRRTEDEKLIAAIEGIEAYAKSQEQGPNKRVAKLMEAANI